LFGEERPVFVDNNLIDLAMSLPKSLRQDSYIYQKMLMTHFSDYYERIAWQQTGYPISWSSRVVKPLARLRRFRYKLSRRLIRFGIRLPDRTQFTDYDNWLRQEPGKSVFSELLFDGNSLYPEYVSRKTARYLWREQQAGLNRADQLCRIVTFELWLRQVFRNEFRPQGFR
jgi:asparagine synthase (glutamine-hydrolysing)